MKGQVKQIDALVLARSWGFSCILALDKSGLRAERMAILAAHYAHIALQEAL